MVEAMWINLSKSLPQRQGAFQTESVLRGYSVSIKRSFNTQIPQAQVSQEHLHLMISLAMWLRLQPLKLSQIIHNNKSTIF